MVFGEEAMNDTSHSAGDGEMQKGLVGITVLGWDGIKIIEWI